MEYDILYAPKRAGLVQAVAEASRVGWRPQGGVCSDGAWFYQAVIRKEPMNGNDR